MTPFLPPKTQAERDALMKSWIIAGDSRRLPVSIRHRDELYALVYRKGDLVMLSYSYGWSKGDAQEEVKAHKEGARKKMSDWLKDNDISSRCVDVFGIVEKADYLERYRVAAVTERKFSLLVPPFDDDEWWKEMKK